MGTPKLSVTNSNIEIKENKMANGLKQFVGQRLSKKVKFMGGEVEISKLTIEAVQEIQEMAKALKQEGEGEGKGEGFDMLRKVIELSVSDCGDLSDQEFRAFPVEELTKLSNEIMKFSGLDTNAGK